MIDLQSRKILASLQKDARQTVQQIAEQVGLSTTPVWKRMKDMEANGVITGHTVRIDRKKLGLNLMAIAEVNLSQHSKETVDAFEAAVATAKHIVRCYSTTGNADYVLTIMAEDIEQYEQVLLRQLFKIPGVAKVHSSIVLREVKADGQVPL